MVTGITQNIRVRKFPRILYWSKVKLGLRKRSIGKIRTIEVIYKTITLFVHTSGIIINILAIFHIETQEDEAKKDVVSAKVLLV